MLGVVNLDKPVGPTSHDMVGLLRRLTGIRRIGHAGTLDPLASGVLPILVGPATRFSAELTGGAKRYDALIRLGSRSATDDAEGPIERVDAPIPDEEAVRAAIDAFVGTFDQLPPAYSARKLGGQVAHRAARTGERLELPARPVTIEAIDLVSFGRDAEGADLRLDLRCGPGTYVRSLARDLGERLGTGGYLRALRRTEAAGLRVLDAVTPDRLEALAAEGRLAEAVLPVGTLLHLPHLEVDAAAARDFSHGSARRIEAGSPTNGPHAVFAGGELLGIGSVHGGVLRPDKVLPREQHAEMARR
jgi:tRNA pseudouridine55 synthase